MKCEEKNEACQFEFYLEIRDNPILYVSSVHEKNNLSALQICCVGRVKNNTRRKMDVVVMEDI
jgi:hypothetical protein